MTNAEKQALELPKEQRDAFWQGYIACVHEFETEMCMEATNTDCPYLKRKVYEQMKQMEKLP